MAGTTRRASCCGARGSPPHGQGFRIPSRGSCTRKFRINIRFNQAVTGLTIDEIDVFGATKDVLDDCGSDYCSSYELHLTTDPDYDRTVIVTIPAGAAENRRGEDSRARTYDFDVDNKAPEVDEVKVNGEEVVIVFDEDLDGDFIPSPSDFSVSFIRTGTFHTRRVSEVELSADEMFLLLEGPVERGDEVSVFYGSDGNNAARDAVGTWSNLVRNTRNTDTSYRHGGLSGGVTRHYRVSAINFNGTGDPSDIAHATTDDLISDAPSGLSARASGTTEIELSWRAPSSGGSAPVTGYRIEMSATGVGGWIIIRANTGSTGTTYLHTGLPPGATRFYRVAAVNSVGIGTFSSVVRGATNAARPGQPQDVRARGTGPHTVLLAWDPPETDGGAPVTGYSIRMVGPNDRNWIIIRPNTGNTATTFTHTGLDPVTRYQYQVAAINRVGAGQWSFPAVTLTHADFADAPTGLTARAVGTARIDLSWNAPRYTGGVSILGYRVEASDDGGATWNIIRRNTNATTTFSDVNLRPATTRHYRVAAINLAGVGPFSNTARATTDATVPGVPRRLNAEAAGTSAIVLSWQSPSDDGGARITGYRIEVSADGGRSWEDLVGNTRTTTTVYTHSGLAPASTRHYRVSAVNRIGVGEASRIAGSTTDATVPDAPTGLVANDVSPTQIDLFWLAPTYNGGAPITGYRIEVSETGATWSDLLTNTESAVTAFSHTGLQPGSTRHYRVSAINRAGTGAASASASAATDDPVQRAGRLNTRVLPHVAAAMTSSTVSAIAGRVDAVARGMGMERRVETNGLSSMAASLSAPGAGGIGLAQGDQAGLAALFGGTAFTMPFGASAAQQQSATGTQLASWGAGEYHYLGEPGATGVDWKGNMVSAHVGAHHVALPVDAAGAGFAQVVVLARPPARQLRARGRLLLRVGRAERHRKGGAAEEGGEAGLVALGEAGPAGTRCGEARRCRRCSGCRRRSSRTSSRRRPGCCQCSLRPGRARGARRL